MIYKIFRVWANIAIRVFYGKIEVSGLDQIPKGVPLLLASNHPNGFLEPIIMACLFPRPLHFMVRGDVFRKKWLKPILVRTNQIPIFRFKDGFSELRKNDSSLQEAYKALDKEAAIILFIEGGTINIKKLRPFQKGLARMASSYLDREGARTDLQILPVAINFVSPFVLRSRVALNVGKPILAKDYFQNPEDNIKQMRVLTQDLYEHIKPMAFHVSKDDRQDTLNKTLQWTEGLYSLPFFPMVSYKTSYWKVFKSVANTIDQLEDSEFLKFRDAINGLEKIDMEEVKRTPKFSVLNYILSIVLFMPAIIGLILNIIPGSMSQLLAKKVLKKDNTVFRASIILSSGVGFYVCYYALIIGILSIFLGFKSFLFLLAWPLGFTYLLWKNVFRSSFLKRKYTLITTQKEKLKTIFSNYNIPLPKN